MPLLPVEQPGKPASADWLSTYKPTFNDAREPASEPDALTADGAHEAEGGESSTVESDAVAAVDDGQGGGAGQDGEEGDGDGDHGSHSQGGNSRQGDSRGDQQGERGGGGQGGERHREPERHAGQNGAQSAPETGGASPHGRRQDAAPQAEGQPAIRADRRPAALEAGGDSTTSGGDRLLSNGPQMERRGTRTPTEWLSDPASGALRAAVVAAGQRIAAERASTPRWVEATQQTHEAEQADRLTLARHVREAEACIQQRDETTPDGSQETD